MGLTQNLGLKILMENSILILVEYSPECLEPKNHILILLHVKVKLSTNIAANDTD